MFIQWQLASQPLCPNRGVTHVHVAASPLPMQHRQSNTHVLQSLYLLQSKESCQSDRIIPVHEYKPAGERENPGLMRGIRKGTGGVITIIIHAWLLFANIIECFPTRRLGNLQDNGVASRQFEHFHGLRRAIRGHQALLIPEQSGLGQWRVGLFDLGERQFFGAIFRGSERDYIVVTGGPILLGA